MQLTQQQNELVMKAVRDAGDYARREQPKVMADDANRVSTKADNSYVTNVDKTLSTFLISELNRITGIEVLSEESKGRLEVLAKAQSEGQPVWVVDPIDGTSSYKDGHQEYAVNVGLLVPDSQGEMQPKSGFVYFPGTQQFFYTDRFGKAAVIEGEKGEPQQLKPPITINKGDELKVAIGWRKGDNADMTPVADLADFPLNQRKHTGPMRTAQVLMGNCHASMMNGASMWDTAGIDAIARAAGANMMAFDATTKSFTGEGMYYGADTSRHYKGVPMANPPFVCASPQMFKQLGFDMPQTNQAIAR